MTQPLREYVNMNWYYVEAGQQRGPVTEAQLENLHRDGLIQPDTLVWQEGMGTWEPYAKVKPTPATPPPASADPSIAPGGVVCSECKQIFSPADVVKHGNSYVCAACKPIFLQRLKEGALVAGIGATQMDYAGFWIRGGAMILDNLIISIPMMIIFFIVGFTAAVGRAGADAQLGLAIIQVVAQCGMVILMIAYNTFFVTKYGATPGKMICGLRVVTSDGQKLTTGRAFGRACAEMLSGLTCYIGYIIAAFDDEKRALHDHICTTRVIRK